MAKRQVQISLELFMELVKYHCGEFQNDPKRNDFIKESLTDKLNKLAEHEKYSQRFK